MPRAEDEAVPVVPVRIARIVPQESGPEHIGHGRHSHGHSWMSRLCLLDRVHGERPDGVDAELVKFYLSCHFLFPLNSARLHDSSISYENFGCLRITTSKLYSASWRLRARQLLRGRN